MSASLHALLTKLNWQQQDLNASLHHMEQAGLTTQQQIEAIDHTINQQSIPSVRIQPEIEIHRMNFIIQEQEKKAELIKQLKNHQHTEQRLKDKLQRTKTELKMLEKYLQTQQETHVKQQQKQQEHAIDDWTLSKREPA